MTYILFLKNNGTNEINENLYLSYFSACTCIQTHTHTHTYTSNFLQKEQPKNYLKAKNLPNNQKTGLSFHAMSCQSKDFDLHDLSSLPFSAY